MRTCFEGLGLELGLDLGLGIGLGSGIGLVTGTRSKVPRFQIVQKSALTIRSGCCLTSDKLIYGQYAVF